MGYPRSVMLASAAILVVHAASCGGATGKDAEAAERESSTGKGPIPICGLLTAQQVSTVLPKHDGGTQVASGPSLTKNIENYQCSYAAVHGTDADLLTVNVFVAADSAAFKFIKPHRSAADEDAPIFRELKIGDGAILYGKPGDIQVETWKGRTVVALNLVVPNAERHAETVANFASIVLSKVK